MGRGHVEIDHPAQRRQLFGGGLVAAGLFRRVQPEQVVHAVALVGVPLDQVSVVEVAQ
jgi:hypothetical protein